MPVCRHDDPTVSIVIATYRRLERLRRCIERTRAGFRANVAYEFIVVGGGEQQYDAWPADRAEA